MKLIYKIGRERGEIVEKQNFEDSIFAEQYERALSLVDQFVDPDEPSDNLKIVAFCGDRGEGKSSCMRTVLNMLDPDRNSNRQEIQAYIAKKEFRNIEKNSFETLDVIDPSFFDAAHNVIELVLGHMYTQMLERSKEVPDMDYTHRNRLMGRFQQAKRCLYTLHNSSDGSIDELQELDALAAGIELKKHMNALIDNFLSLIKKQWLIVSIDDIDLNMAEAYKMSEHIRKYLACTHCIVFIGVKLSQLQDAIAIAIQRSLDKTLPSESNDMAFGKEIAEMSRKYIGKLLPAASRINMPQVYSLCDQKLQIRTDANQNREEYREIKNAVVELIFNRTRYLFYNSKGGVSPVIPNNLRDLIALIGLLVSMPCIEDSHTQKEALEANKRVFKAYFFATWIKRVPQKCREQVEKIINYDLGNALNKTVVAILGDFFSKVLEKDYGSTEESENATVKDQTSSIRDSKNFSYNVSLGDVFYLFRLIEMDSLDEEAAALIFFLKSLYSIKLYEAYDVITDNPDMVYPADDEAQGIYRIDARFNHTNPLQRLLCGGYFSYCPGDLLPMQSGNDAFDMRVINGKALFALLKEVQEGIKKQDIKAPDNDVTVPNFDLKLRMAEFFILTITRSVPSKQQDNIVGALDKNRKSSVPFYLRSFFKETGFYLFDILAPFYNLANPKFAYERFSTIASGLFDFAMTYEGSLLHGMIAACRDVRPHSYDLDNEEDAAMHCLQSDAIIRNAEVLSAVYENAVLTRDNNHKAVDVNTIQSFYERIQDSHMATHEISRLKGRYGISFHFLKPLQDFISEITAPETSPEMKKLFNRIFRIGVLRVPTVEQIMKELKSATVVATLYTRLRNIPYFKKWSDDQLAAVIPNDKERLTTAEIQTYIKQWWKQENQQRASESLL